MTQPVVTNPPRQRRAIPLFILFAIVLFVFALIVASGTAFLTSWAVWLCGGLISLCLHWWFNLEL